MSFCKLAPIANAKRVRGLRLCNAMMQCSQVGASPAVFSFRQPIIPPEALEKSLAFRFADLAWLACASAPHCFFTGCWHGLFSSAPFVAQATIALRAHPPVMVDLEESSDTAESALRALLANARVPEMLAEHIPGLGFEDVADFAYAYSDTSDLSTLLDDVPAEIWTALEVADYAHSIPAAHIRKAFEIARAASTQETHAHMPKALGQPTGPASMDTHASPAIAWAEHLLPKLTPEVVQDLVDKFQKNYPAELLGPDSMPSIHLLSMVYEMTKSKHFKWIP